jgi:hypothetical protein
MGEIIEAMMRDDYWANAAPLPRVDAVDTPELRRSAEEATETMRRFLAPEAYPFSHHPLLQGESFPETNDNRPLIAVTLDLLTASPDLGQFPDRAYGDPEPVFESLARHFADPDAAPIRSGPTYYVEETDLLLIELMRRKVYIRQYGPNPNHYVGLESDQVVRPLASPRPPEARPRPRAPLVPANLGNVILPRLVVGASYSIHDPSLSRQIIKVVGTEAYELWDDPGYDGRPPEPREPSPEDRIRPGDVVPRQRRTY